MTVVSRVDAHKCDTAVRAGERYAVRNQIFDAEASREAIVGSYGIRLDREAQVESTRIDLGGADGIAGQTGREKNQQP